MTNDPKTKSECPICSLNESRLETGKLEVPNDWPGIFIRGDNALYYAACITDTLNKKSVDSEFQYAVLQGLRDLLFSCEENNNE